MKIFQQYPFFVYLIEGKQYKSKNEKTGYQVNAPPRPDYNDN